MIFAMAKRMRKYLLRIFTQRSTNLPVCFSLFCITSTRWHRNHIYFLSLSTKFVYVFPSVLHLILLLSLSLFISQLRSSLMMTLHTTVGVYPAAITFTLMCRNKTQLCNNKNNNKSLSYSLTAAFEIAKRQDRISFRFCYFLLLNIRIVHGRNVRLSFQRMEK